MEVASRLSIAAMRPAGRERVGPCPVCGGKDRFSINPDMNIFNCRICARGGDQIALVEHIHGCDFKAALAWLVGDAAASIDPDELARRQAKARAAESRRVEAADRMRARAVSDARWIWKSAQSAKRSPVVEYLAGRGLEGVTLPPSIRYLPDHPYVKKIGGELVTLHRGPCMIAGIQSANGRVRAVHQTWIDPKAPGSKARIWRGDEVFSSKLVRGSKKGGAIRLSKSLDPLVLVMGEGIETTMTAMQADRIPGATYWAGVDLGNMAGRQIRIKGKRHSGQPDLEDLDAFLPPIGAQSLIYIQDGDSAATATRAKLLSGLLRAKRTRPDLKAQIIYAGDGLDLNDLLKQQ